MSHCVLFSLFAPKGGGVPTEYLLGLQANLEALARLPPSDGGVRVAPWDVAIVLDVRDEALQERLVRHFVRLPATGMRGRVRVTCVDTRAWPFPTDDADEVEGRQICLRVLGAAVQEHAFVSLRDADTLLTPTDVYSVGRALRRCPPQTIFGYREYKMGEELLMGGGTTLGVPLNAGALAHLLRQRIIPEQNERTYPRADMRGVDEHLVAALPFRRWVLGAPARMTRGGSYFVLPKLWEESPEERPWRLTRDGVSRVPALHLGWCRDLDKAGHTSHAGPRHCITQYMGPQLLRRLVPRPLAPFGNRRGVVHGWVR